jgi:hypothetical protein
MALYYKVRRELESCRAEDDQRITELNRSIADIKRSHADDIQIWQNKVINMQLSLGIFC